MCTRTKTGFWGGSSVCSGLLVCRRSGLPCFFGAAFARAARLAAVVTWLLVSAVRAGSSASSHMNPYGMSYVHMYACAHEYMAHVWLSLLIDRSRACPSRVVAFAFSSPVVLVGRGWRNHHSCYSMLCMA